MPFEKLTSRRDVSPKRGAILRGAVRVSRIFLLLASGLSVLPTTLFADVRTASPSLTAEQSLQSAAKDMLHTLGGDDSTAFFGFSPRFELVESASPNAFARENPVNSTKKVVISTGLLKFIRTQSEFAFVVAHELGHFVLGHQHTDAGNMLSGSKSALDIELAADRYAIGLLHQNGLQTEDAAQLLTRVRDFGTSSISRGAGSTRLSLAIDRRIAAIHSYLSQPRP